MSSDMAWSQVKCDEWVCGDWIMFVLLGGNEALEWPC